MNSHAPDVNPDECNCPWCEYERRKQRAARSIGVQNRKPSSAKKAARPAPASAPIRTVYTAPARPQPAVGPAAAKPTNGGWLAILGALAILIGFIFSNVLPDSPSASSRSISTSRASATVTAGQSSPGSGARTSVPSATPNACFGAPAARMGTGMRGRVTYRDNTALILRSEARISKSTYIKDLREGTRFTVVGGPACADGYIWWNIRTREGTLGWSAEGDRREYFMEPFNW